MGRQSPPRPLKRLLEQISEDEKAIVEDLFILSQEIEGMKAEEEKAGREIELLSKEISELDKSINARQKQFDEQLSILEQVLVAYQEGGPATFIETLLNSKKPFRILLKISMSSGNWPTIPISFFPTFRKRRISLQQKRTS